MNISKRSIKGSDLFVEALVNEGVEYIFAVPGEENLDMLESIRGSKIKLIVTRHEQSAAFMAATYCRLTGRAGVCINPPNLSDVKNLREFDRVEALQLANWAI